MKAVANNVGEDFAFDKKKDANEEKHKVRSSGIEG